MQAYGPPQWVRLGQPAQPRGYKPWQHKPPNLFQRRDDYAAGQTCYIGLADIRDGSDRQSGSAVGRYNQTPLFIGSKASPERKQTLVRPAWCVASISPLKRSWPRCAASCFPLHNRAMAWAESTEPCRSRLRRRFLFCKLSPHKKPGGCCRFGRDPHERYRSAV